MRMRHHYQAVHYQWRVIEPNGPFQFLALALPPRDSNSEGVYHFDPDRIYLDVPLFNFSA